MENDEWRQLIAEWFPVRDPITSRKDWEAVKNRLSVGQTVSGIVIAKAPFGAWLDIGVGFAALLLIPDVAGLTLEASRNDQWCPIGTTLHAQVVILNDVAYTIRVAQGVPHELRVNTPAPTPDDKSESN